MPMFSIRLINGSGTNEKKSLRTLTYIKDLFFAGSRDQSSIMKILRNSEQKRATPYRSVKILITCLNHRCYFNHSCNPNCGLTPDLDLTTLKEITTGEELMNEILIISFLSEMLW